MNADTLLANPDIIRLESFISEPNAIMIVVHSKQKRSLCPKCHQPSSSLHSHYRRAVSDLPWHGVTVKLLLNTRKFRCRNELCRQKIFCERLPDVVKTYARKTCRLDNVLTWLAFALGGEAGARTSEQLRMKISGDTLLRLIRRFAQKREVGNEPKVVGVDDWAWRKGCTYGTIIVDLEKRKVIDLLPDREARTLTNWLLAHPSVETVARDRSPTYCNGIIMGNPFATQIADRWHLLSNLGDALEKMIERLVRKTKRMSASSNETVEFSNSERGKRPPFEPMDDWQWNHLLKKSFEDMKREACRRRLLPHLPSLPKAQIPAQEVTPVPGKRVARSKSPQPKLDVKMLRALCFYRQQLSEEELEMLCYARAEWDEFDRAFPLIEEFVKIIRGQSSTKLSLWIVRAFDSKVTELRSWLHKDFLAVKEAIASPWSNGQTEGQVNRLKLLKRQMYGRAKFDLLKARVLNPA